MEAANFASNHDVHNLRLQYWRTVSNSVNMPIIGYLCEVIARFFRAAAKMMVPLRQVFFAFETTGFSAKSLHYEKGGRGRDRYVIGIFCTVTSV